MGELKIPLKDGGKANSKSITVDTTGQIKAIKDGIELIEKYKSINDQATITGFIEAMEKRKEKATTIKSCVPKNCLYSVSKVAREMPTIDKEIMKAQRAIESPKEREATAYAIELMKGKDKPINSIISINYEADNIRISGDPLTKHHIRVCNGICTLWEHGCTKATPTMIYRAINGLTNCERVTQKNINNIIKIVDDLRYRKISITTNSDITKYYPNLHNYYSGYVLPVEKTIDYINGEAVLAYEIIKAPIVYEYSKALNQVVTVSARVVDIHKKLKNTDTVSLFRDYLIQRISSIKDNRTKLTNNCIKYSTIFKESGIDEAEISPAQANKHRGYIKRILDHFKAEGFIKSYSEYKKGRKLEGVKIKP